MKRLGILLLSLGLSACTQMNSPIPRALTLDDRMPPCMTLVTQDQPLKIAPGLREKLEAFASSTAVPDQTLHLEIWQCFRVDEFYLDNLKDPRVNPRPRSQEVLDSLEWRPNIPAWEASVVALRRVQYQNLEAAFPRMQVEFRQIAFQQLTVRLPLSDVFALLKRPDVYFVYEVGEIGISPIPGAP